MSSAFPQDLNSTGKENVVSKTIDFKQTILLWNVFGEENSLRLAS